MSDIISWNDLADAYGFIGNSLLEPMTRTATVGLDPEFWRAFPDFDDDGIRSALSRCADYAERAGGVSDDQDAIEKVSVEFTRLFIGPPSPAAAPWETMYRAEGVTVGFGQPTFEMREILREAGLGLSNENRQYEDHMGIELLYLSTRCGAVAADDESTPGAAVDHKPSTGPVGDPFDETDSTMQSICDFIEQKPLSWIGAFRSRIAQDSPQGYYHALVELAESMLMWHADVLHQDNRH